LLFLSNVHNDFIEQQFQFSLRSSNQHQGLTAEFTVVLLFNQGVCTAVLYSPPCLNFLVLFFSREKVHEEKLIA